jgi:hypothetical protein
MGPRASWHFRPTASDKPNLACYDVCVRNWAKSSGVVIEARRHSIPHSKLRIPHSEFSRRDSPWLRSSEFSLGRASVHLDMGASDDEHKLFLAR